MALRPEQLPAQLNKGLAALYLVFGEEPLQMQEALDAVRRAARAQGCGEREVFTVDASFDWGGFMQAAASASLFGERRLLELRLGSQKPGDEGSKALIAYAERPPPDAVLLVSADKLDKSAQKTRWFLALEKSGTLVQSWPIDAKQLPAWIEARMRRHKLNPTPEAVALLAERVEGNLLAAAQDIDKLSLLYGSATIDADKLLAVVSDSAHYTIFDLADAALAGQAERVVRIVAGLRGEGAEPVLTLWALHRDIALLTELAAAGSGGFEATCARLKIWDKRKPLFRQALLRLAQPGCRRLLRQCAAMDRVIKGIEPGVIWDELLKLTLELAGVRLALA